MSTLRVPMSLAEDPWAMDYRLPTALSNPRRPLVENDVTQIIACCIRQGVSTDGHQEFEDLCIFQDIPNLSS